MRWTDHVDILTLTFPILFSIIRIFDDAIILIQQNVFPNVEDKLCIFIDLVKIVCRDNGITLREIHVF